MIFCVEDDDNIRELLLYTLKSTGFEAQGFIHAEEFWEAMEKKEPQLIILDIMLANENGLNILERLRTNSVTNQIPIIMATAKGTEYDKIKGLDLGADDYLVKPFGMMEMVSRIKAVLRRSQSSPKQTVMTVGQLVMNTQTYTVLKNNIKIELTLKEFDLLALLLSHPKRVFTRQELLDRIWGDYFIGETRTVDVHIGTLRTKLGSYGSYIKTIRGVGYQLEVSNG